MSLVLEALRRVEKPSSRTGSMGVAVASYRTLPGRRSLGIPLLLGLLTGGAAVLLFAPEAGRGPAQANAPAAEVPVVTAKGRAGLPPPLIVEPLAPSADSTRVSGFGAGSGANVGTKAAAETPDRRLASASAERALPTLVLQAISERDSRPIAIINDRLVNEGDKLGSIRVLRIGDDSVEVLLENGTKDIVRFAPPPPPEISPSPIPPPEGA